MNKKINRKRKTKLKKILLIILSFFSLLLILSNAYAKEIIFNLKEFGTNKNITKGLVEISIYSGNVESIFKYHLDNTSLVKLNLNNKKTWDFTIKVDDERTPTYDYFVRHHLERGWNESYQTIHLFPVGSVNIRVEDINKNLVSNAKIRIECLQNRFIKTNTKTDFFGTVSNIIVPVGNCSVYASFGDAAGISNFYVKKGEVSNIIITLNKKIVTSKSVILQRITKYSLFLIVLALLLILILSIKKITRSMKKNSEKRPKSNIIENDKISIEAKIEHNLDLEPHEEQIDIKKDNEHEIIPSKILNVISTLNEKEKRVIEYLLENNLEDKQSIIRYKLRIPKSTFSRIIKNLENKKIIIVDRETKPVKIKINPKFI